MADAYSIPPAELVARLRDYEGEVWETTMCFNGLRDAAAARIEELESALDASLKAVSRHGRETRQARFGPYGRAAE